VDFVSILEEPLRAGTDSAMLVEMAVVVTVAEVCASVRGIRATQEATAGHEGRSRHLLKHLRPLASDKARLAPPEALPLVLS